MNIAKELNAYVAELSACMGMGAASLTLTTSASCYSQGAEVVGTLLLAGGVVAQHIESLVVKLEEYHGQGKSAYWKTLNEVALATNLTSEPGRMQEFGFRLSIPQAALLSSTPYSTHVVAEADILWAVNPRIAVFVTITPPPEIMTLDAALQQIGFLPRQSNFTQAYGTGNAPVEKSYRAPDALYAQITHATLNLTVEKDQVVGYLMLNHAEAKLTDLLRAALGEDKQFLPVTISCASLQGAAGAANALALLKDTLNQALILPDNEANWMLRAASPPPETGDTLLRAADAVSETHPDQLLHSSEQTEILAKSVTNTKNGQDG